MSPPDAFVLSGLSQVITNDPARGGPLGAVVGPAAIAVARDTVAWVGPESDLPTALRRAETFGFDGMAALPGFVDSHTHAVFAGHRADEFSLRIGGAGYAEILAGGGGIHSTVRATRSADPAQLAAETRARLESMAAAGTTTAEVKSGYGLDVTTELRQLEIARSVGSEVGVGVETTFLAHVPDPGTERSEFLDLLVSEILPVCAPNARFCDVFCDDGAFSVDEARVILEAGVRLGLTPKLHAEQLTHTGAATLAAELGAVSADHLDHATAQDAEALAAAGTVGVLLPGVSLSLRTPMPPARMLREAGVTLALATDCNPGSSYVTSMPFVVALAVLEMGMTAEEAVWAATRGGALALGDASRGRLVTGYPADIVILETDSYHHLAYRPGSDLVAAVYRGGTQIR